MTQRPGNAITGTCARSFGSILMVGSSAATYTQKGTTNLVTAT